MPITMEQKATHPSLLTPEQRLAKAAEILATAVLRKIQLEQKEQQQKKHLKTLDVSCEESVHGGHSPSEEHSLTVKK